MPFPLSQLDHTFILHMVFAMYAWEAKQVLEPSLMTDLEMNDFYNAYMGGPF